jgi:hypothetical protein
MAETDYLTFSCSLLGKSTKEYFASPLPKREFEKALQECPFWQERDSREEESTKNGE